MKKTFSKTSKLYDLFEKPANFYDVNIQEDKESSICLIFNGIIDINSFILDISELFSCIPKITKVNNRTAFLSNISAQNFNQLIEKKFKIFHYDIFTIFLKKSATDNLLSENTFLKEDLFYIYFEEKFSFFLSNNLDEYQIKDIKVSTSNPKKHFYGFSNLIDLVQFYSFLLKSTRNWPIFAISPFQNKNRQKIDRIKLNEPMISSDNLYPKFSPLKNLFYISIIQKVPPSPQREFNFQFCGIKRIPDVQISHLKKATVCTFLGFENKFKCLYIFDYLNGLLSKSSSNDFTDVKLIKKGNDNRINSNFFYLEIFKFYDPSIDFSLNYVDTFNLDNCGKLTTFYCFDNEKDFNDAKSLLKRTNCNDSVVKNIRIIDNEDFIFLFPQKNFTNFNDYFYLIFRMKNDEKKEEIINLLNGFSFINDDVTCQLDNKKYTVVAFYNVNERNNAFTALTNSDYSRFMKCYYPQNYVKPINKSKNINSTVILKQPQFKPMKGLFYIYFEEYAKSKSNFSSNYLRPIFGIRNHSDLQRNYYLPNSTNEYTFIGFQNENDMSKILRDSYAYQNVLITNAKNGQIYKYQNGTGTGTGTENHNEQNSNNFTNQPIINSIENTNFYNIENEDKNKNKNNDYDKEEENNFEEEEEEKNNNFNGEEVENNIFNEDDDYDYNENVEDDNSVQQANISTNVPHQVEMRQPQFKPKKGLYYIYFEEYAKSKINYSSNYLKPIFGIHTLSDLQRNYYLPNSINEYTFIGFQNEDEMEKIFRDSYKYQNSLILNAKNGQIYKYKNEYQSEIHNEHPVINNNENKKIYNIEKDEDENNDNYEEEEENNNIFNEDDDYDYNENVEDDNSVQQTNISTNVPHQVEMRQPQFKPKKGLYYIYFEEYAKSKSNFSSNYLRPIFGIRNHSDLQRNYYLPNSTNEYTFIGFQNENDMSKILRDSYAYQNVLITNAKNGQIYKYQNGTGTGTGTENHNEQNSNNLTNQPTFNIHEIKQMNQQISPETKQTNSKEINSSISPQFKPKEGMFYIYFQEHEGGKPRYPSDYIAPIFGIQSLSDLQRNYYLPNSAIEYTFIGFKTKEEMDQVYNDSLLRKNKLITNTKDGKILKYLSENITTTRIISSKQYPTFKPKNGLFYLYFEENDGSKPRSSTNHVTPLFGIKNISDLQRSYCLPGSKTIFTFIGFSNNAEMEKVYSESYPGRKVLMSNVKNFKIYKYKNNPVTKPISVTKADNLSKIIILKKNQEDNH